MAAGRTRRPRGAAREKPRRYRRHRLHHRLCDTGAGHLARHAHRALRSSVRARPVCSARHRSRLAAHHPAPAARRGDWRDCWSCNCSYQAGNATLAAEWAVAHQADPRASFVRGRDVAAANPAAAEAIRYDGEARFDARAALVGLLATETGKHIKIFEESAVTEVVFDDKARGAPGVTVKTPTGQVHAATAIMTTGRPLEQFAELHPLLTAQVTYALTAYYTGKLPISDDVFWDTDEPYQYYRRLGQDTLILGGADHLADEPPPEEAPHEQLEKFLRHKLPGGGEIRVTRTWSGSLFYTEDGVPYIGRHPRHPNLLIATGFGGAGMVPGALAALTLADLALAPTSPHAAPASGAAKLLAFERTGKALPLPAPLPQQPPVSGTTPPGWRRALITTLRILLPLVFIAALVTPAVVFFSDRGGTSFLAGADLQTFSILMFPLVGLYAFTLLWVQFLLGSSMYPLKAIFPRVELFHRTEGVFVLLFALTHPTLILLGTGSLATYLQYKFVAPNLVPWAYVGEVQLTLLILTVATALLRKTKWLKRRWHTTSTTPTTSSLRWRGSTPTTSAPTSSRTWPGSGTSAGPRRCSSAGHACTTKSVTAA
ncbi:MAG: FAD-binding oxidoreductase [Candidatus Andersenbacteria bacterium]